MGDRARPALTVRVTAVALSATPQLELGAAGFRARLDHLGSHTGRQSIQAHMHGPRTMDAPDGHPQAQDLFWKKGEGLERGRLEGRDLLPCVLPAHVIEQDPAGRQHQQQDDQEHQQPGWSAVWPAEGCRSL